MSKTATAATATNLAEDRTAAPSLPLVEYFQRFYERVVRLKRALVSVEESSSVESAEIVQQELLDLLEQQNVDIHGRYGKFSAEILARAHYAMAALADETFIHMEWSGRERWRDQLLLEAALFDTFRAGDEVFRRIDEIVIGRTPSAYALASIYLMVLGLGFEGKYRRTASGSEQIELHQRRLMAFITRQRPELDDPKRHLMPEAYKQTADDQVPAEIPNPRRWFWGLVAVVIGWLLISHMAWRHLIADLKPILSQILYP